MVYQDVRLKILRRVSSKKSQSSGCCAGSSIKLPSFVQTALRNEIKEATEAVSFSLHASFHVQHGSGSVLWQARRSFRQSSQKLQALQEIVPKAA